MAGKGLLPESLNPKVLAVSVLALVVLSMAFIPQLITAARPGSSKRSKVTATSKEVAARQLAERVSHEQGRTKDPFDTVINKFDSGEYDKIPAAGVEAAIIPEMADNEPKSFWARLFSPMRKDKGLKALRGNKTAQRKVLLQALRSGKATWDILQLPVVVTTIQRASAESQSLFRMLPPEKAESRLAVRNFIAGLDYFQGREIRSLSPQEGLQFLRRIDRDVTDSLIKDNVGRELFNIWRNVSLETLLVTSGALDYRDALAPPFLADIIVTSVAISDETQKRANIIRRKLRWSLTIAGVVESAAATRIELLGPGNLKKSMKLPTTRDGRWRAFSFSTSGSPYGQFILRVSDEEGGFVEKFYHFLKVGIRYRNPQTGDYRIPQVNTREKDRPVDRILDRMFSVGNPRVGGLGGDRGDIDPTGRVPLFVQGAPPDSVPF